MTAATRFTLLEKIAPRSAVVVLVLTAAFVGIGILVALVSVLVMFAVWLERRSRAHPVPLRPDVRPAGTAGRSRSPTG